MTHSYSREAVQAIARWFGRGVEELGSSERKVLEHALQRRAFSEDPNQELDARSTLGERLADRVARFGGSWRFIMLFGGVLVVWTALNTAFLGKAAFDPYPYIFLNLMLSMLAALQAPVIMMSQNRQSLKDRRMATHDYEVNLKAEIEIMSLHDKLDSLRSEQLLMLINKQQEQLDLLTRVLQRAGLAEDQRPETR